MPELKHQSVRQRTNKASTRATLFAVDPANVEVPELPVHPSGMEWQAETLEWWQDVWASPMSSEFVASDVHGLYRLAMMVDDFWIEPSPGRHAEIRIAQQAYGLTPYDRRRLEWTIEGAEAAKDRGNARRRAQTATQHEAHDDPRLRIAE